MPEAHRNLKQIKVERISEKIPTEGPVCIPLRIWCPKSETAAANTGREQHPQRNNNMSTEASPTGAATSRKRPSASINGRAEEPPEGRNSDAMFPIAIFPARDGNKAQVWRVHRPCSANSTRSKLKSKFKMIPTSCEGRVRKKTCAEGGECRRVRSVGEEPVEIDKMKVTSVRPVDRKGRPSVGNRYTISPMREPLITMQNFATPEPASEPNQSGGKDIRPTNVLGDDHPVYYVTPDGQLAQVLNNGQPPFSRRIETQTAEPIIPIEDKKTVTYEETSCRPTQDVKTDQAINTDDNQSQYLKYTPASEGYQRDDAGQTDMPARQHVCQGFEPQPNTEPQRRCLPAQGGDACTQMLKPSRRKEVKVDRGVLFEPGTLYHHPEDLKSSCYQWRPGQNDDSCRERKRSPVVKMDKDNFVSPVCTSHRCKTVCWSCPLGPGYLNEDVCCVENVPGDCLYDDDFHGERFAVSSIGSDKCFYRQTKVCRRPPTCQSAYQKLTEAALREFQLQQVKKFIARNRCRLYTPRHKSSSRTRRHKPVVDCPVHCTDYYKDYEDLVDESCSSTPRQKVAHSSSDNFSKPKVKGIFKDESPRGKDRRGIRNLGEAVVPPSPYLPLSPERNFTESELRVDNKEERSMGPVIGEFPINIQRSQPPSPSILASRKQDALNKSVIELSVKGAKDFESAYTLDSPKYRLNRLSSSSEYGLKPKSDSMDDISYKYDEFFEPEMQQAQLSQQSPALNVGDTAIEAKHLKAVQQLYIEQCLHPEQDPESEQQPTPKQQIQWQQKLKQPETTVGSPIYMSSGLRDPQQTKTMKDEKEPVVEVFYPPPSRPKPADTSWDPDCGPCKPCCLRPRSYFYRKCVLGGMSCSELENLRNMNQGRDCLDCDSPPKGSALRVRGDNHVGTAIECCEITKGVDYGTQTRPKIEQRPSPGQGPTSGNGKNLRDENWMDCGCAREPRGMPKLTRAEFYKKYFQIGLHDDGADADGEDTDMANNSSYERQGNTHTGRYRETVPTGQSTSTEGGSGINVVRRGLVDKSHSHNDEIHEEISRPHITKNEDWSPPVEAAISDKQPEATLTLPTIHPQYQGDGPEDPSQQQFNKDDNDNKGDEVDLKNERFSGVLNPSLDRKIAWRSSTKRPQRSRLHRSKTDLESKKKAVSPSPERSEFLDHRLGFEGQQVWESETESRLRQSTGLYTTKEDKNNTKAAGSMLGSTKEIPIPKPRSIRPTAAVIKPRQARKDPSVTSPTTASPVCNSHPPLTTQQPPSPSNWTEQSPISERVRKLVKEDETSTVGTTNTMAAVLEKFRRSKSHSRSRVTRASILRKHVTSKTLESKPDLISTARDKISFEFEHSPVPNISPGLNYKPRNSHKPTSSLNGHAKDITRRFYSSLSQKAPTPEKTHHSTQYLEPVTRVSAEPESVIPVKGSGRRNSPRKVSETRNWLKESSETRNLPRDCCKGSFTSEPRSDITAGADAIPDACECQTNLASTGLVLEPKYIETSQSIPSAPRSSPDLLRKRCALSCHQKQRFGFYAVQEKYSGDSTEFSSVNKLGSLVASMPSEKVFIHQDVGPTSMNPRSTLEASLKNACVESDSLTMWEQNSTQNSRTKASDLRQEMVGEDDDGELPKTAFLPGVSRKDRNRKKRKSTGIQDTLVDCNIGRTNDTTTRLSGFETVTFANQSSNKVGYESAQQELNTTRNAREKSPNEGGLTKSRSGASKRDKPKKSHKHKRGSPPTTSLQSVQRDVRNEPTTSRRVMEVSMETRDDFSGTAGERKRNYESSSPEINDSQVLLDEPSMYTSAYDSSSDYLSQQSQSSRESDVELTNDISAGQSKQSSKRSFKGNLQSESPEGKRKSKHGTSFSNELGGASSPPRSRKIEQKQNRKIKDNRQTDAFYDSKRANDFDMSFKSSKEDKRLPKPTPKSSKNKLANAPSRNLKGAGITKTTPLPTSKSSSYSDSDDDDETATVSHKKVQTTLDGDSKRRRSGRRNILQSLADSTYGVLAFICRTLRPFDLLARPQPCRVNPEPPKTAADPEISKADVPEEEKEDEEDNLEKRKGLVSTHAGVEQPKAVAQPEVNVKGNCGWLNTSSYYPGCDPLCDVEYEMILIPTFEPVCPRLDQANQLKSEADEASRRGHEEHLKENNSFGQDELSHHDSTRYTPLSSQSLRACEEYGPMADYRRPRAGEEYGPMYEYPRPRACEEYGPMADYRKPRRRGKERPRSRRRYEENMPEVDSPSPRFYEDNIHMTSSNIHNPKEADNAYMTRYPRSARDDSPEDLSPEYDQNEETTATQPVDNDNSSTGFSQALDTRTTQSESNQLESEADKARQSQENRYMKKAEKPRRNQANHVESEADKERQNQEKQYTKKAEKPIRNQANHVESEADKERQNQARQSENETDEASRNQANQLKSEADRAKLKQAIRAKRKHEKARRSHAKKVVNKPDEPNQNQANQSKNETDEARQSQANPSESEADEASRRENEKNLEPVEQATPKDDQEDDLTKSETEILPTGKSKEKGPDRRYFYKTTAAILRNKKRAVSRILAGKHTNKQNNSLVVAASCPGRVSECECLPFDEKTIPHQYASNHAESFVLFPDPHRKCLMVSSSDRHGLSCQTESPGGCGEDEIHTLTSRRRGEAINLYDGFPKVLEYESLGTLQDHSNYCDSLDHVSMYNQTHLNPDNQRGKHSSRWANVDLRASLPRETFDGARTCQWFGQFGESSQKLSLKTRSRSLDVQSHRNVSQNQSCSPENIDDFFCSGHSLRKSPDKTRNRGSDKKPVLLTPKFVDRQSTKEQHLSAWNRHHSANGVEISYRRNLDMCDNMSLNKNALPPPPHTTEEESNGEFHSANTQTAQTRLRDGPGGNTNVSKSVKDDQPSAELSTSFQDAKSQSEAEEQGHGGDPVSENSQQPNFEIEDNTEYRDLNDEHEIPENTGKIDKAKYDNVPETGSSANTQNITESSDRQQLPCSDEERGTGKHRPTDRPQRLAHSRDRIRSAPQWDGPADRRDNVSPVNCYKADQLEFDPEDQRSPNLVVPLGSTSTSTGVKSERKDDTRSPVSTDYETPKRECVDSWIGSGSNPDRPKYKCGRYDDRHSTRRGLGDLDYYQIPRSTRRGVGNNVGPSSSNELGNRYSRERFSGRKRYQPRGDSCERETRPRSRSYVNEARSCYCGYCNSNKESDVKENARQSQSFSSKYPSGKDTSGPKDFWRSRRETPQDIAQNSSPEDAMPRETRTETGRDGAGSRYRPASGSSNRQFYQSHQARLSPRAQLSPSPRFAQSTGTRKFYERVPQSGHDDPEFSPRGQEVDQSSRRQARARRTSRTRDFQESTGSSVSRHGIIEEAGKKGSQRYKSSSKRQRRVAIEPRFRSPAKHGQSRVAYVDQFSCDDSGYVEAGCKREHRIGSRKISFMGLRGGRVYCPPLKKKAGKDDDMPPKAVEKPSPPGVLIFQIAARYATFGGIRVAGGVRVLMDAPEKLGYVQIVSPLGQPFITHHVNTMSFLHSSSAAGVAWSAVVWDTGEEDSANNNKKKGKKESDDIVGRVDSAQVIFCEPYQAHRFRAVLETIKAAFSGGDGALITPNVPPIPGANNIFNPCNPCNPFNPCNPCSDPCNPGPCGLMTGNPIPCPTVPNPDTGFPCQMSFPPFPPPHSDPCCGGNGVTSCCAPPCCPQPSVCPPPFCSQACCPPETMCMPPCTTPCPMPMPTSFPGQCAAPSCCPDDCDPYAYTNAYGKTLFCQMGCLVKLGREEVWLEMYRGNMMVIQEPHSMGFSLVLVNEKQVVLVVQKLSRKTDFKPSPHTQYGFLYTACTTTEKGSLHENFLVSFQCKAHAEQFCNVVTGCKRIMAMSGGNLSNSAVCAPGTLKSCVEDPQETNAEVRAKLWETCPKTGPCGVPCGCANSCYGDKDYSPVAARNPDCSCARKSSGPATGNATGGRAGGPRRNVNNRGFKYVGPSFRHGHGREDGRVGCLGKMVRGGAPPGQIPEASGLAPTSGPPVTWEGGPRSPAAQRSETASEPGDVGTLSRHQSDNVAANTVRKEPSRTSPPETTSDTGPDQTTT